MAYKYYNQNDYPEIPYGDGSIETSGCGLCSAPAAWWWRT